MAIDKSNHGDALLFDLEKFRPEGMTLNGWAVAAGVSRAVWGDIRRHGNPSRKTLEKLLAVAQSSLAEFEALRVGTPILLCPESPTYSGLAEYQRVWRSKGSDLSALATMAAGNLGGSQAMVPLLRAAGPIPKAPFALRVCVTNMEPRFRAGRSIVIDPQLRCLPGNDVMVGVVSETSRSPVATFFIAHLVDQSGDRMMLRQYAPPVDFDMPIYTVAFVYKVLGEAF